MSGSPALDIAYVRSRFPVLANDKQVFFDNAGGTQCLGSVIDSVRDYLTATNVQLGGSYDASQRSTALYKKGVEAAARYVKADPSEIVIGPSTTQLFRNLSIALTFSPDDELVLSKVDHEANVAPWLQLAKWKSLTIKWWTPSDPLNPILDVSSLQPLLSPKTRLVACTHTSNVLGTIHDIRSIASAVHSANPNALLCVDGVAYAPHRALDLKALDVDFYSFSWYKVYGPHIAVLYAKKSSQEKHLESLGHFFKPPDNLENMLGLAAANYELTASIPRIIAYLESKEVGGWEGITAQEERLQEILLGYLRGKEEKGEVTIYGERSADPKKRVSVVSFTVNGKNSRSVIDGVEKRSNFGARDGHFYAKRLLEEVLGVKDSEDGVVRVSLVHYNTEEEVRGFVKVLDQVLSS